MTVIVIDPAPTSAGPIMVQCCLAIDKLPRYNAFKLEYYLLCVLFHIKFGDVY